MKRDAIAPNGKGRGAASSQGYNTLGVGPWYYLLPGGDLYEQAPSSYGSTALFGALVAHLGPAVYADPSLLWNAPNSAAPATLTVATNQLTIAPNVGYLGTFVVLVTVDDGHGGKASGSFNADYRGPKPTYNVTTVGGGRQG